VKPSAIVIRTPEGIEFSLPLAGPVARMMAMTVDFFAVGAASSLLGQALTPVMAFLPDLGNALYLVLYFVLSMGYGMATEWAWRGQTLGKRLLRLRVVDAHGLRLDPSQIVMRNLLRAVDALPLMYLVGGVVCLLSSKMQRLGDLAAGTAVVRVTTLAAPDLERILGAKFNSLLAYRHLAARLRQRATPELAALALEALVRRDELEPASRLQVFSDLAARFRSLVTFPDEAVEQLGDEQYVRNVVEILYQAAR
jgi:uncharacterized RDD family membrane protein YckC